MRLERRLQAERPGHPNRVLATLRRTLTNLFDHLLPERVLRLRRHGGVTNDAVNAAESPRVELGFAAQQTTPAVEDRVGGLQRLDVEVDVETSEAPEIEQAGKIRSMNRPR